MKASVRETRQAQIEQAAYDLLAEKGFGSTSMLAIAKRAKCSNETLYNWYGDKTGLIRAMVTRNADEARTLLNEALRKDGIAIASLEAFGPVLLALLLSDRAVALNRAAAADATGELGRELAASGRGTILPLLVELFERARDQGALAFDDVAQAVELYLGVLIGDLQIRRVIGSAAAPAPEDIARRNALALRVLTTICS